MAEGPTAKTSVREHGIVPDRAAFKAAARTHTVIPVRRSLLADQITPVAMFARLCGNQPGFLLESVDHGGRWSRWSFLGREPRARVISRGGVVEIEGDVPTDLPTDQGILAAVEALLEVCTTAADADLPLLHAGVVGYLGYDVVREIERLPDVPPDDRGWPDASLSLIGDLVAMDHWSQQVTLIANAFVRAADGAVPDNAALDALYDDAVARLTRLAADGATPIDEPLVDPPSRSVDLPDVVSTMSRVSTRVLSNRRRSTSWPATSSRSCSRSAST